MRLNCILSHGSLRILRKPPIGTAPAQEPPYEIHEMGRQAGMRLGFARGVGNAGTEAQNCGTVLAGMLLSVDPFAHIAK